MAILKQGILGGFTNKVGTVVGYIWNGLDVIRGYVIPRNPNTTEQANQRGRFRSASTFASGIYSSSLIKHYWNLVKGASKTAYAAIMKANIMQSGLTAITEYCQVLPAVTELWTLANINVTETVVTATVPILSNIREIPAEGVDVEFENIIVYSDPVEPGYPAQVVTSVTKNVASYNFAATYSLSTALNEPQKTAGTQYQRKTVWIVASVNDADGNRLFAFKDLAGVVL